MIAKQQEKLEAAIARIVIYLWDDEERDYQSQSPEGQAEHIFASLRQVKVCLNQAAARRNEYEEFGYCPRCGGNDGFFNIGRAHYFHCRLCRTKWFGGENLFSGWRQESEADVEANAERFADYESVPPGRVWSKTEQTETTTRDAKLLRSIRAALDRELMNVLDDAEADIETKSRHVCRLRFVYAAGIRDATAAVVDCVAGQDAKYEYFEPTSSELAGRFDMLRLAAMPRNAPKSSRAISKATGYSAGVVDDATRPPASEAKKKGARQRR